MNKFLDWLVPRFLTEEVALLDRGDHYEIVCAAVDVRPGENIDAYTTVRAFNLFGYAMFPKLTGDVRPVKAAAV